VIDIPITTSQHTRINRDDPGGFMRWYQAIRKRLLSQEPSVVHVEEYNDVTDEIEKSLWDIKESLDLPTEEIEISLETRRRAISLKSQKSNS
jgi:hypothetical protein